MTAKTRVLSMFLVVGVFAGIAFGFVATSLNNIIVGGEWSQRVSIRFQAQTSSSLAGVRLYWITGNPAGRSGYASGTDGHYAYSLHADSNGQPEKLLSTASMVENRPTENGRGNFPLIDFPPASLVSGQYYDIVVENVDSNPKVNWASLDFLWNPDADDQTGIQIWVSDEGGPFGPGDHGTFIGSPVALFYANGKIQGHGDIAVGSSYPGGLECGSEYGFPTALCQ